MEPKRDFLGTKHLQRPYLLPLINSSNLITMAILD